MKHTALESSEFSKPCIVSVLSVYNKQYAEFRSKHLLLLAIDVFWQQRIVLVAQPTSTAPILPSSSNQKSPRKLSSGVSTTPSPWHSSSRALNRPLSSPGAPLRSGRPYRAGFVSLVLSRSQDIELIAALRLLSFHWESLLFFLLSNPSTFGHRRDNVCACASLYLGPPSFPSALCLDNLSPRFVLALPPPAFHGTAMLLPP